MFKVGKKVWIKDLKEFGTLVKIDIENDEYHSELVNGIDFSHADNIHDTSQTMFATLGFTTYSIANTHYIEHKITGDIIKMRDNKIIECLLYNPNVSGKFLAVNQLCIEKGWL